MDFIDPTTYTHICDNCRAILATITRGFEEGLFADEDDEEAPSNMMYDRRMFCGGHECINKPAEHEENTFGALEPGDYFRFDDSDLTVPSAWMQRVWMKTMPCTNPHEECLHANAYNAAYQLAEARDRWVLASPNYRVKHVCP